MGQLSFLSPIVRETVPPLSEYVPVMISKINGLTRAAETVPFHIPDTLIKESLPLNIITAGISAGWPVLL